MFTGEDGFHNPAGFILIQSNAVRSNECPCSFHPVKFCWQRVLAGLNPDDGSEFVTAYIADILVFSSSLDEHLKHLQAVLDRLQEVGLKLNPVKCKFAREEVDYLGHVITAAGL